MLKITATPKARTLDAILRDTDAGGPGDSLDETIARLCTLGWSGRRIAEKLTEWTGVPVSHRSVARWIAEARADAEAAA